MALALMNKKEEIYGYQTLFREIGYYISRLEHYERSLKYYDQAIQKTPNDRRALIGRSRSRAKACLYEEAIEDVNKALSMDPDDLVVLADKALNTYLNCEFEEGLIQNTRLLPVRKKPDNFSMGVMHCTNAIENCVGERTGRPLRDHFRIIRKLAWKKTYEAQKPYEPKPSKKRKKKKKDVEGKAKVHEPLLSRRSVRIKADESVRAEGEQDVLSIKDSLHSQIAEENIVPPLAKPFPFKPLQNYTSNIENYMAEKYLDSMYLDKIFLKKLQTEPGATCPNKKGSIKIKQLAKFGFKTVSYKQELLRTRRPFYFIKYQEARSSGALKKRQREELLSHQNNNKKDAEAIVTKLRDALADKRLKLVLELAEKLKQFCDSKPKRLLVDKDAYLQEVYSTIRRAFYQVHRLNKKQFIWDQEKRIYMAFGLPISREPSSDSVIEEFKNVFIDYKKQIRTFEKRLKTAELGNEMCWCYHELARYHIELNHLEIAGVYGRKLVQEARKDDNWEWIINAKLLLAKIDIQQHNKNDAKGAIHLALGIAEQLEDESLADYLNKCLEVVEKIEFDDILGPKVLEQREQKIISMMASAKMKDEVSHLFRMMSAMPASRRMCVMPGVRMEEYKQKSGGRNMSIMPGRLGQDPNVKDKGKATKKPSETRGVEFMELVQYHV